MYETDHSDALAPVPHNADWDSSLMGEAKLIKPELRSVRAELCSVRAELRSVKAETATLANAVDELRTTLIDGGRMTDTRSLPNTAGSLNAHHPGRFRPLAPRPSIPCATQPQVSLSLGSRDHASVTISESGAATGGGNTSSLGPRHRSPSSDPIPSSGLVIPDVPVPSPDGTLRPRKESWRDIIRHWTDGAPDLGLHTPLRDWPWAWTRGRNRIFATKYFERSVIAQEFIKTFDSDEKRFLAAYPQAERGHTALLRAINAARRERGERETRPPRLDRRHSTAAGVVSSSLPA